MADQLPPDGMLTVAEVAEMAHYFGEEEMLEFHAAHILARAKNHNGKPKFYVGQRANADDKYSPWEVCLCVGVAVATWPPEHVRRWICPHEGEAPAHWDETRASLNYQERRLFRKGQAKRARPC